MSSDVKDRLFEKSEIEEETLKQLLVLEKEFREHKAFFEKELLSQNELVSRIWVISQRHILLKNTVSSCQNPETLTAPTEYMLLEEFLEKTKLIQNSNCDIYNSLKELRKYYLVFEKLCAQLDMNNKSPIIIGDALHKPIAFFIELVSDLFKYFHGRILKLRCTSYQFDSCKIDSIETYKKLMEPSEDFEEYFNVGLAYCKCLRSKPVC